MKSHVRGTQPPEQDQIPIYGTPHGIAEVQTTSYPASLPHALSFFQWKAFLVFTMIAGLIIALWSSSSDIFEVPSDVTTAYKNYQDAKRHYYQNSVYWDSKREHFERAIIDDLHDHGGHNVPMLLETLTPEMIISFLARNLKLSPERLSFTSIMSKENSSSFTLILSKFEQAVWPLKIIVSLEAEVSITSEGVCLYFTRLRRGSEDLATGLAWAYFGSDLEMLKPLPVVSMRASQPATR